MPEPWEIRSTASLPLLPGPLGLGAVAPDRLLSMGQIELFDILTVQNKWLTLNRIVRDRTVWSFSCR